MGDALKNLPGQSDPRILIGYESSDDAAIFRLDEKTLLVQTVDFFTPIVDDPRDFGAISAANSLSDVYAMGGRPLTALALVCFPYKTWPMAILEQILLGGAEKMAEAGAVVVGGHSVADEEIKFGYSVTGTVPPDRYWPNNQPRVGDALILTKPLGTGFLTTAVKRDLLDSSFLTVPVREMKRLNAVAAEIAANYQIHAATDITGFGLLGHLYEMLKGGSFGAELVGEALPLLPGLWEAIAAGAKTGALRTNREYVDAYEIVPSPALDRFAPILLDPQTSGGLLLALPEEQAGSLQKALLAQGQTAARIGKIIAGAKIQVT